MASCIKFPDLHLESSKKVREETEGTAKLQGSNGLRKIMRRKTIIFVQVLQLLWLLDFPLPPFVSSRRGYHYF
ncbi:hypothetical protein RchiOBHm_Chr2g0119011 [Rosa chinensis]|uniref:Uncharacterized protein n=1 Tax=Rosa chinensis TaxID=74649 RepID=A0A2P6RRX0_ROSCH|nr:hypothetical protein RchiOBHm_Chr2g0119011 [Rosa chinensis]